MNSRELSKIAVRCRKLADVFKKEGFEEEYQKQDKIALMIVNRAFVAFDKENKEE